MGEYEVTRRLSNFNNNENLAIISIKDYTQQSKSSITDEFKILKDIPVLQCYFDDVGIFANKLYKGPGRKMQISDAFRIKRFVDNLTMDCTLWVHCTAGISRSGAVGCTLARYLHLDELSLFMTGNILPNEWVYQMMCIALGINYSYEELRLLKYVSGQQCIQNLKVGGFEFCYDEKTKTYSFKLG